MKQKILKGKGILANYIINSAGCWVWQGYIEPKNGYGRIHTKERKILAHRYFYEKLVSKIPKGMCLCHKCDIKSCVNPEHLFIGTPLDNVTDMILKKRNVFGERHRSAILTEKDVLEIRKEIKNGRKQSELAKKFGVYTSTISRINTRHHWKHL